MNSFSDDNYVPAINPAPVEQFLLSASLANKGRECLSFEEKSLILGSTIAHLYLQFSSVKISHAGLISVI